MLTWGVELSARVRLGYIGERVICHPGGWRRSFVYREGRQSSWASVCVKIVSVV